MSIEETASSQMILNTLKLFNTNMIQFQSLLLTGGSSKADDSLGRNNSILIIQPGYKTQRATGG